MIQDRWHLIYDNIKCFSKQSSQVVEISFVVVMASNCRRKVPISNRADFEARLSVFIS